MFVAAAIAAGALVAVHAADSVTFVLTNGQRVSGDIASTSEASAAMPNGELNLEKAGADERSYGWEMVAAIEYDTNAPSNDELRALPAGGHMLVLRDGSRHQGRMVSLRNGVLRWSGMSGQVESYGIERIARIYMNTDAARSAYNYKPEDKVITPPVVTDPTPPTGRRGIGGIGTAGAIRVPANRAWTDTGRSFKVGEVIQITAAGSIKWGAGAEQTASAAGNESVRSPRYPVPSLPVGALIGRIGNGTPFPIGAETTITVPSTGRLLLGINDDGHADNTGEFRVIVTRR
jgi:hypothetical protein